jgi:5'-nucleotidase
MRILVTNDDGIEAPGLRTLVQALSDEGMQPWVAAPDSERSATGHGITILRPLTVRPAQVPGAVEAYAVDGRPADTTMLALSVPDFFTSEGGFDLVLSGINRGNNTGLHVIYSGTVAGAREAACKGVPALALSLDHHSRDAEYSASAAAIMPLVRTLGRRADLRAALSSTVVNVNVPHCSLGDMAGYALDGQSVECTRPGFKPVPVDGEGVRAWMNSAAAGTALDRRPGFDAASTNSRHVSLCVLTLTSHAALSHGAVDIDASQLPKGVSDAAAEAVLELAARLALASGAAQTASLIRGEAAAPAEASL